MESHTCDKKPLSIKIVKPEESELRNGWCTIDPGFTYKMIIQNAMRNSGVSNYTMLPIGFCPYCGQQLV